MQLQTAGAIGCSRNEKCPRRRHRLTGLLTKVFCTVQRMIYVNGSIHSSVRELIKCIEPA